MAFPARNKDAMAWNWPRSPSSPGSRMRGAICHSVMSLEGCICNSGHWQLHILRDFRLSSRCSSRLRSSGMLGRVDWQLVTDISVPSSTVKQFVWTIVVLIALLLARNLQNTARRPLLRLCSLGKLASTVTANTKHANRKVLKCNANGHFNNKHCPDCFTPGI
jgi:hypothetical protein